MILHYGDSLWIELTRDYWAAVDAADFDVVKGIAWYAAPNKTNCYARASAPGGETIKLHQRVARLSESYEPDHIDGDGLNNRRSNLRPSTHKENCRNRRLSVVNTSGFKGVSFYKRTGKFIAKIEVDGDSMHLGYFHHAEDAATAYRNAAKKYHGEFARAD